MIYYTDDDFRTNERVNKMSEPLWSRWFEFGGWTTSASLTTFVFPDEKGI